MEYIVIRYNYTRDKSHSMGRGLQDLILKGEGRIDEVSREYSSVDELRGRRGTNMAKIR